jgi:hypothetical protein
MKTYNETVNTLAQRQLINACAFAVRMAKKKGSGESAEEVKLAIADAYSWAPWVSETVNTLTPEIGWPTLSEILSGKAETPAKDIEASDEVIDFLFAEQTYNVWNTAYWFAKAFDGLGFQTPVKDFNMVLNTLSLHIDDDMLEQEYNGTNIREFEEKTQKSIERQEFLQLFMSRLMDSKYAGVLAQIHEQIVESHQKLLDEQRAEEARKTARVASQLFGKDFEFQAPAAKKAKVPEINIQ